MLIYKLIVIFLDTILMNIYVSTYSVNSSSHSLMRWFVCGKQGLSSHSTILSGLLAFIITYASPFLFLLGMMLLQSPVPKSIEAHTFQGLGPSSWLLEILAVPCIVPVALNGIIMVAFTAILTVMQDHLFVWSVFSPKYELPLFLNVSVVLSHTMCCILCEFECDMCGVAGIYMFVQQLFALLLVHLYTLQPQFITILLFRGGRITWSSRKLNFNPVKRLCDKRFVSSVKHPNCVYSFFINLEAVFYSILNTFKRSLLFVNEFRI